MSQQEKLEICEILDERVDKMKRRIRKKDRKFQWVTKWADCPNRLPKIQVCFYRQTLKGPAASVGVAY